MSTSATAPQNTATPPPGRDARGRFAPGNPGGPGNPFARQTAQLRKVLLEVVTPEEMRQVAFTLLLRAKTGNLPAIKLLLQYVIGKPAEGVDPDRLEVEEWKLAQESKVNVAEMHDTVQQLPAETANVIVRHARPAAAEANYVRVVEDELEAMDREDAQRARLEGAEANGGDGEASPRPLSHEGRGEEEKGGEVTARGGRHAKPQAAAQPRPLPPGGEGRMGTGERSAGGRKQTAATAPAARAATPRQTAATAGPVRKRGKRRGPGGP
jgi:hypothetical protein